MQAKIQHKAEFKRALQAYRGFDSCESGSVWRVSHIGGKFVSLFTEHHRTVRITSNIHMYVGQRASCHDASAFGVASDHRRKHRGIRG